MDQPSRLEIIKQRLSSNAYFVNPLSDANVQDDIAHLVALLEESRQKIAELERKNKVLSSHALELTQEMENIRSDFGADQR